MESQSGGKTNTRQNSGSSPAFRSRSLKVKLLLGLIPPVVILLIITGYVTYRASTHFIRIGLQRSNQLRAAALAHEVERFLEICRNDLTTVAQYEIDHASLHRHLANLRGHTGFDYRELAFISQKSDAHLYFVAHQDQIVQIPFESLHQIKPDPFTFWDEIKGLAAGGVWISGVLESVHPFPTTEHPNQKTSSVVIYFAFPYSRPTGEEQGILLLSLDVRAIRNILSLYNSERSPLGAHPEPGGNEYSYFFDREGWILFESGNPDEPPAELSTDRARSGFDGTLGSPDLSVAFKPESSWRKYWQMVREVAEGKAGSLETVNLRSQAPDFRDHFLAYVPVLFKSKQGAGAVVYGGIAQVGRSTLTQAAFYRQMDVMFMITVVAILAVSALILLLGHLVTRPILDLARRVQAMEGADPLEPIGATYSEHEILLLRDSINRMVSRIREQKATIETWESEMPYETLSAEEVLAEPGALPGSTEKSPEGDVPGLLGHGPKIDQLRSDILKAARADVDVLIAGETGTGKQLAAEAIHAKSLRADKPFVSINCGELDEHLLLDTLFGHVRGAFTEAKTDRKGAFVEANGGTLFLDEIQTASPAVQQALLRSIAQRKIRPLGSDHDVQVDVRMIAATNEDLKELVARGKFRKDLFFRLEVLMLHTPPLREQMENLPLLVTHYFSRARQRAKKNQLSLSRGTLEKMKSHSWPGNVRELINCITRAVAMAEGPVVRPQDIMLEGKDLRSSSTGDGDREHAVTRVARERTGADRKSGVRKPADPATGSPGTPELNPRQEKAYAHIRKTGVITRAEYQLVVDADISARTAIYDLQDLVRRGLLRKSGRGPATRYLLAGNEASRGSRED